MQWFCTISYLAHYLLGGISLDQFTLHLQYLRPILQIYGVVYVYCFWRKCQLSKHCYCLSGPGLLESMNNLQDVFSFLWTWDTFLFLKLPGLFICNYSATIWESTKPLLCSKLALFKTSWQMLKVILCYFFILVPIDMAWGFQMSHFSLS